MEHVVACGICCDVCELNEKLGCVCSSGVEDVAKQKVATRWAGRGLLCLVLDCAVRRGITYCTLDCDEFLCEKYFEWCLPYGKDYLEMHVNRKKDQQGK